jgi:hypothetical protein
MKGEERDLRMMRERERGGMERRERGSSSSSRADVKGKTEKAFLSRHASPFQPLVPSGFLVLHPPTRSAVQ